MPQPRTAESERATAHLQGHWLLARLGKRVLRPGGRQLTEDLLDAAQPRGKDVVEFAPGLGITARSILRHQPATYKGVERDPAAAERARRAVGNHGEIHEGDAADTGLDPASADVVVGEAMLSMQSERQKETIIREARRLLRLGGHYAIHELLLRPEDLPTTVKQGISQELARTIKVNARPLTVLEWTHLLESCGFTLEWSQQAPMTLLEPRRMLADEGPLNVARIVGRALRDTDARRRALHMRATFRRHRDHLGAIGMVARAV